MAAKVSPIETGNTSSRCWTRSSGTSAEPPVCWASIGPRSTAGSYPWGSSPRACDRAGQSERGDLNLYQYRQSENAVFLLFDMISPVKRQAAYRSAGYDQPHIAPGTSGPGDDVSG